MLLHHKLLLNQSASNGFVLEEFDFKMCGNHKVAIHFWASCTMVCFVFGFPASVAILWELLKTHRRGTPFTPNNFFMLNLSAMDTVFLFFVPPGLLNQFIWHIWVIEAILNCVYALNICGRPLLMVCICLDCCMAVVHPVIYHKKKSLTPRIMMVGVVWTLTVAAGIVYTLFPGLYFTIFSMVPFIIALVIILICDSFILHTLIRSDPGRKNIHPQKQRAIQVVVNSLVIAAISYLPPVLLCIFGKYLFDNEVIFRCTIVIPLTITSTLGSAIMPMLYLNNLGKLNRFRLCKKS